VLDWLQLEADDQKKSDDALVFSDETGEPVGRFRTAWVTALLKAHGVKPEWKACGWTGLTPECAEQFRRINLHWHDLRHEYASRLVEKGVPLAQVRDPRPRLDYHDRALRQPELENLQAAAARLESGKSFDAPPRADESPTECQVFVKNLGEDDIEDRADRRSVTEPNSESRNDLADWLGVRDDFRNWLIHAA
jgi:hypothetical protein